MEIDLGPSVEDCLNGINGPHRYLEIPESVLVAERNFENQLVQLVATSFGQWVVVTEDGKTFLDPADPDQCELAARAAGYSPDRYVVRLISDFELVPGFCEDSGTLG